MITTVEILHMHRVVLYIQHLRVVFALCTLIVWTHERRIPHTRERGVMPQVLVLVLHKQQVIL